jgi:hypothetical protein
MYYLLIVQVLCGFFSAFVAGRKGRNRLLWWFIGALLPLLGVVLCLKVGEAADKGEPVPLGAPASADAAAKAADRRRRPSRCCGSYIPDCLGCSYFRRQLFSGEQKDGLKGRCEHFDRELLEESSRKRSRVTIEEK